MEYDWPGHVRELENLIKRVVVLGSETNARTEFSTSSRWQRIDRLRRRLSHPAAVAGGTNDATTCSLKDVSGSAARVVERELILKMLQQIRWNRKETTENLGISYKALLHKIKENGLDNAS
jgi:two-component system, NtrC family, response regulator AtoC